MEQLNQDFTQNRGNVQRQKHELFGYGDCGTEENGMPIFFEDADAALFRFGDRYAAGPKGSKYNRLKFS